MSLVSSIMQLGGAAMTGLASLIPPKEKTVRNTRTTAQNRMAGYVPGQAGGVQKESPMQVEVPRKAQNVLGVAGSLISVGGGIMGSLAAAPEATKVVDGDVIGADGLPVNPIPEPAVPASPNVLPKSVTPDPGITGKDVVQTGAEVASAFVAGQGERPDIPQRYQHQNLGIAEQSTNWDEANESRLFESYWSQGSEYDKMIQDSASEAGVDPWILKHVLFQESSFFPRTVSGKHPTRYQFEGSYQDYVDQYGSERAVGIGQMKPSTAADVAGRLGMEDYDLFDPATAIRFSAHHMKWLKENYTGENLAGMIGSYNAGQGAYLNNKSNYAAYPQESRDYMYRILRRAGDDRYLSTLNAG